MKPRLLADEDTGHGLISACQKAIPEFPIIHIATWLNGAWLGYKDPQLLSAARVESLIMVSFDRSTLAYEAGRLTKTGAGHAGVILFRRSVLRTAFGQQAELLTEFWREESAWEWNDSIIYLPR